MMKWELRYNNKTLLFLASNLVIALVFIIASTLLFVEAYDIQKDVKSRVNCIKNASLIDKNASLILKRLNDYDQFPKELISKTKELAQVSSDLRLIANIMSKYDHRDKLSSIEISIFQQKLIGIGNLCTEIIFDNRAKLSANSKKLNEYWKYTHYSLIVACLLMILLIFIVFYVTRTKRLLTKEKKKNKFLFDNSINCIIICDKDGNISEYNPAAEQLFGYTNPEIRKLGFQVLYNSIEELELVNGSLNSKGSFSGEIINKKKDGSLFVSFLSANLIYDVEGEMIGSMGISRDITSQKKREQQFHSIINNAQDIIYTANIQGDFTFANNSGSNIMGYQNNELIGKHFSQLVHPDDVEKVSKFYTKQFNNKDKRSYLEFKGVTKTNDIVWLGQNITTLFSPTEKNKIIGFQGVVRDISKRIEAEANLKSSEESFRAIVNTITDVFYLFDFRIDRFAFISPNTLEVLGIDRAFFNSGKSFFFEYVYKNDLELVMKSEMQLIKGEPFNIEYRIITKNRIRWVHDRAFPIRDENNKVVSYSGVIRDITDVKSSNLIIEEQNEEINQSISYAQNIQKSTLLTIEEIYQFLPESFILFNPRDVLSGDFYIVDNFNTNQLGNLTAFAVADCTGHGVPGGMLSFLCNSLMQEAFSDNMVNSPSEVLEFVRGKLVRLFRSSSEKHIHDGMDIALCALDREQSILYYSGANLPLIIVRDEEFIEIKGDRQHVGYNRKIEEFSTQVIDVQEGDIIYLYSDGYQDQFGGENGKKFLKRRLKELLLSIHKLSL